MIEKINFKHSLIFFNFCIFISAFKYLRENNLIILCLFLILCIGITHGSLDHIKGKKLLKIFNIKNYGLFFIGYLAISILTILIWLLFPKTLLLIFLIVASYHFGKEDSDFLKLEKINFYEILLFFKGSVVITSPLLFHQNETYEIFKILNFDISNTFIVSNIFLYSMIFISFLVNLFFCLKENFENKSLLLMDFFSIIILNLFLNPLLAFTLYFCFLHSIRHSLSLIFEINSNIKIGLKLFIKKAFPLTFITAIFYLGVIYYLKNDFGLDRSINKVIFIGLASLTFPHILLEYFLKKNGK
tara:strand:- start:334 stop:1236 length:903 start_codon:yes stop_codon:yes gene_type:complete